MFRGMKSTKLSGSSGSWNLANASCESSIVLSDIDSDRFGDTPYMRGCAVSRDGLHIYVGIKEAPIALIQLNMTIPGDLSTVVYSYVEKALPDMGDHPLVIQFSPDGLVLMMIDQTGTDDNNYIYQYSLSSAWEISSLSYVRKYKYNTVDFTHPASAFFIKEDGLTMFLAISDADYTFYLHEYSLNTAWDLASVALTRDVNLGTLHLRDGIFSEDGKEIVYFPSSTMKRAILETAWDIESVITYDDTDYEPCVLYYGGWGSSPGNSTLFNLQNSTDPKIVQIKLKDVDDYV